MENKTNIYINIKDSTLSVKEKSKLLEGKDCIFLIKYILLGVGGKYLYTEIQSTQSNAQ